MNCPFCHQEIKTDPEPEGEYDYCDCGGCKTYFSIESGKIVSYGIHVEYRGKVYAAFFHPLPDEEPFSLAYKEQKDELIRQTILTLNFRPNITPQNFLQKLPILLVFS